jgi:hypothetical protein
MLFLGLRFRIQGFHRHEYLFVARLCLSRFASGALLLLLRHLRLFRLLLRGPTQPPSLGGGIAFVL